MNNKNHELDIDFIQKYYNISDLNDYNIYLGNDIQNAGWLIKI